MKISLTDIINKRAPSVEFEYYFMPDADNTNILLPENIELSAPLVISGKIIDKNEYMSLEASVEIKYKTKCDRCLEEIERDESYGVEAMITLGGKNGRLPFDGDGEEDENVIKATDSGVDITEYVMEELSLALPVYNLCSDDCMGLCPKCGAKLSEGDCGCKTEKEIDPRLLIFKKLLENQE